MADRKDEDKRTDENSQDNLEYENFQKVLEQTLSVPKEELDKRRAEYERGRKEKRAG